MKTRPRDASCQERFDLLWTEIAGQSHHETDVSKSWLNGANEIYHTGPVKPNKDIQQRLAMDAKFKRQAQHPPHWHSKPNTSMQAKSLVISSGMCARSLWIARIALNLSPIPGFFRTPLLFV